MGKKANPLLLIVDVQRAFINQQTLGILPVIRELMPQYQNLAATKFHNWSQSNYVRLLDWRQCFQGDEGRALALRLPEDTLVIKKNTYNGFTTALRDYLFRLRIHEVHLCGMDTDACILATALSIFDAGLRPVVLANACASSGGRDLHEAALTILRRNIGEEQVV